MENEIRLIDANALKQAFRVKVLGDDGVTFNTAKFLLRLFETIVDESPTVEDTTKPEERSQGKWLTTWDSDEFTCERCRSLIKQPTFMGEPSYKFCPNCGTPMLRGNTK